MRKFSRLMLALPLAALVAGPVHATQWFDFSITFNGTSDDSVEGTLTGRTATGDSSLNTSYALGSLQDLEFSANDGPGAPASGSVQLYDGPVVFSEGTNGAVRTSTSVGISFSSSSSAQFTAGDEGSSAWYFTVGDEWSQSGSPSQSFWFWDPNRGLLGGTGVDFTGTIDGTSYEDTVLPQTVAPDVDEFSRVASAELVPEINGSGFAYIAFILGALGLWLYSGAGRGRVEEEPVAT